MSIAAKSFSLLAAVSLAVVPAETARAQTVESLMAGKVNTGRSIVMEAVINAPPERLFQLWTTPAEIPNFFAPRANIEPRLGGAYEMIFDPDVDPLGDDSGTRGARILRFEPGRALSFEWTGFTRTGRNPRAPVAWPEQRDRRPIATWVDLSFEPVAGNPNQTRLRFAEHGFQSGGLWEDSVRYFWLNWALILGRLGAYCERGCAVDPAATASTN